MNSEGKDIFSGSFDDYKNAEIPTPEPKREEEKSSPELTPHRCSGCGRQFSTGAEAFACTHESTDTYIDSLKEQLAAANQSEHWLKEILAILHGDGGHYAGKFGIKKASEDAISVIYQIKTQLSEAEQKLAEAEKENSRLKEIGAGATCKMCDFVHNWLELNDGICHECWQSNFDSLRLENAALMKAVEAWDHWDYEVSSARVNGESIYSAADFADMKEKARTLAQAALAALTPTPK